MSGKVVRSNNNVRVYNNVFNNVSFRTMNDRVIDLPRNGSWRQVKVEDLDFILSTAPAMFTEGILFVKDKGVREYLDIEEYYEDGTVIPSDDIAKLLEGDAAKIDEALKKASKTTGVEVAKQARAKSKELTGAQIDTIEKNTGMSVRDEF